MWNEKSLLSTSTKLRNRLLASSFSGNNLQICRRSHFRGVGNSYFTILEVTLVLVNNACHLLKDEVRRQIWALKLVHAKHESMALEETDSIKYYSDYYFERLCQISPNFMGYLFGQEYLNFISGRIAYECWKTEYQHVCTYLAFHSLIKFQTSLLLIINDLNRLLNSVLILTVAYRFADRKACLLD